MKILPLFLLVILFAAPSVGQTQDPEAEVRQALWTFLHAFENLDWDLFRQSFDENASVFYPRDRASRADGRAQIEEHFREVFAQIRGQQTHPPYMHIDPRDLRVQMLGDTAIVTFHLDDRKGMRNRRTVILHKGDHGWKIVHLHASEVKLP